MSSEVSTRTDIRTVWLHVHVPKAGGSTLRQLMNRNFGTGYYNSTSLFEVKQYRCDEVEEIIRCHPWLKCFSDHKLSLDLPWNSPHASVQSLAFVRDPVERFISRYFFHRHYEAINCVAQRLNFREFVTTELEQRNCHPQTNSQIYFLTGGQSDTEMRVIDAALATEQAHLFPIERFDESCVCLEKLFPGSFSDLSYVPANVSQKDLEIFEADRALAARWLELDQPVVTLANRYLDQMLARAFEDLDSRNRALAEFKDRCARRFHNFFPPVAPGQPVPPIGTIPSPTKPEPESPVDPRFKHLAQPTLETKPTLPTETGF